MRVSSLLQKSPSSLGHHLTERWEGFQILDSWDSLGLKMEPATHEELLVHGHGIPEYRINMSYS